MKLVRILTAIALLYFVFFGSIPNIDINPIPDNVDEVAAIITIEKPSDEIIDKVKPVADLVKETEDIAKIALFNYEFSNRVTNYNCDVQQLNDIYTKAGSRFFKDSLKDKYENLAEGLQELFQSVTTNDNHMLTDSEKESLRDLFSGLSWVLIER